MIEQTDIRYLKGVGEKRAASLQKLGLTTIGSLLYFFPRAYEDWSNPLDIEDAPYGENCCVKAFVLHNPTKSLIRRGMTLFKTTVSDGKSRMTVTIFNNQYAAAKLRENEEFLFYGRVGGSPGRRDMNSPLIDSVDSKISIHPIYPQTQGITSKMLAGYVSKALEMTSEELFDPLPDELRQKFGLCHLRYALENIHFPADLNAAKIARKRFIFEELFYLQLGLLQMKGRKRAQTGMRLNEDYSEEFFSLLPFSPTNAQKRCIKEALNDMGKTVPMNRLLQGDVGSGKTAVAAALLYTAVKNSMQGVLMAPTEILAEQHFHTLKGLLKNTPIRLELLTGSMTKGEKLRIKKLLSNGEIDVLIGTHAVIQNDVEFARLGLVITDEQHRFGVAQRSALAEKGENPHTLVMSATPIPRTLALMVYGDLDVSVLDELPPGRQKIDTFSVSSKLHQRAYNYVKKHLDEGRQGYVICPLVEEGESDLIPAQEYIKQLQNNELKGYKLGLLHGKMKPAEKERVMREFSEGKIQLLVSTTVVEVGVDVPNAVIMVIENAERFGLSQLHQLRGRVGRGQYKSTCILITDAQNDEAITRMQTMCRTNNGFEIADADLKLRGPGDFFGSRQHGLPNLKIANLLEDMETLNHAQEAAKKIIAVDPKLTMPEHTALQVKVTELFERVGDKGMN